MPDTVVVGAGLSGLVSARRIAEMGYNTILLEKRDKIGGRVRSFERDGYTFDRGFQVFFTAYPYARRELDYDALDFRYFEPGARIATDSGISVLSDPLRDPSAIFSTLLNTSVTFGDKLRILRLRRELSSKGDDEIFEGGDERIDVYLRERGFSERFIENFARPFYGGITLDLSLGTSKKVFEFTFKMLSVGKTALPSEGMGAITRQLAEKARESGVEIETGVEVRDLKTGGDTVTVETSDESIETEDVVVATDPKTARELTGIESIPVEANGCVTQYYELDQDPGLGKKLLLNASPDSESPEPNHIAPISNVAPEYAPDDSNFVSATFLSNFDTNDDELAEATEHLLDNWFGTSDIDLLHTDRIEFAQFPQPPGIHDELPSNRAPDGNIYLAGEYTEASSINAAIASGRKAARALIEDKKAESEN